MPLATPLGANTVTSKQPKRTARSGVDAYGRTPLHYAALEGNESLCQELLSAGADVNAQDDNGWAPLHFAADKSSGLITTLLLRAGANPNICDTHGNTALAKAVFSSRGDGSVIALLRSAGADPDT
ncbi:MAG: ankyrin repeat domain-containing protein, partial [bacterium]|nr:ankyrin repeat domain-containing protein [bacterium]